MMSGIRGKNTKPELIIRKALHAKGFRYQLHSKKLPGKPDLLFPKYKAAIFINGCFWHGHDCSLFKLPATRTGFWEEKISGNKTRDVIKTLELAKLGYRVLTVWECTTRNKKEIILNELIEIVAEWISGDTGSAVLDSRGLHVQR